jgi:hypothetical protein
MFEKIGLAFQKTNCPSWAAFPKHMAGLRKYGGKRAGCRVNYCLLFPDCVLKEPEKGNA